MRSGYIRGATESLIAWHDKLDGQMDSDGVYSWI